MESGSGENRQETQINGGNMENANEPVEENVPKILSSELRDVFPIFTNMLDVKSFMKLAMTSKDMYNRCMDDKSIKINVNVNKLIAIKENGSVVLKAASEAAHLLKLPCNVNVGLVELQFNLETADVTAVHNCMKKMRVKTVDMSFFRCENVEWEAVFAMIKEFEVKSVDLFVPVSDDVLRSFLQLNLDKFWYNGPVSMDFLLKMESSVPEITFNGRVQQKITKDELMRIISRIQSGSLHQVNLHSRAIEWNEFDFLPLKHEGPLPEHRPLVLGEIPIPPPMFFPQLYWLLDSHGGITKWITCARHNLDLQMLKCDHCDYPWILRKEDDVLKDLAKKRQAVSCSAGQFHKFSTSFTMVDRSHKRLPTDRPLGYQINEDLFWMLDVGGTLKRCSWEIGVATWTPFLTYESDYKELENSVMVQHVFWRLVAVVNGTERLDLYCEGLKEFDRWFEVVEQLDFEYSGLLPKSRPLVFWKSARSRVVLFKDRLILCEFFKNKVFLRQCTYLNRPPILFTAQSAAEMLKDPYHYVERSLTMTLEMFRDGFKMFRRSQSVRDERLLIWEQVTNIDGTLKEEYWYKIDSVVRKVVWKEGRVLLKEENDLRESPPNFMKQIFRHFAGNQSEDANISFTMEFEQFRSCLEQFSIVPFDYSGPLTSDSPMAFVKNEIRHTFHMGPTCQCSDYFVHVWLLWNGNRVTNCSWGKEKPKELAFRGYTNEMPPALGNIESPADV